MPQQGCPSGFARDRVLQAQCSPFSTFSRIVSLRVNVACDQGHQPRFTPEGNIRADVEPRRKLQIRMTLELTSCATPCFSVYYKVYQSGKARRWFFCSLESLIFCETYPVIFCLLCSPYICYDELVISSRERHPVAGL